MVIFSMVVSYDIMSFYNDYVKYKFLMGSEIESLIIKENLDYDVYVLVDNNETIIKSNVNLSNDLLNRIQSRYALKLIKQTTLNITEYIGELEKEKTKYEYVFKIQ